jgi:asparagine N-glycosylation enzyme membrane subunit Stt3
MRRILQAWPFAGIPLLALAIRLRPWAAAFTPGGVTYLVDTDPHYHVLRATRIVQEFPRVPLLDPRMNFPVGAKIIWPPLFDYLIALPAMVGGGSPSAIALVAALLSPLLGAVTVVLVMALAQVAAGRRAGILAGLLLAACPEHLTITVVGRPDQHSAELLLHAWVMLAFACGLKREGGRGWGAPAALGAGLALGFWNWQGSAVNLLPLAVFAAGWHVLAPEGSSRRASRTLALGAAAGALLLILSLALVMPGELRLLEGRGVTGFHVLLLAALAVFSGLLGEAARRWPGASWAGRMAQAAIAALVPGLALLALGGAGFRTNLTALGATNRWYQTINEFWPLFVGGPSAASREIPYILATYGLLLFSMPFAAIALVRRWRRDPASRALLGFLLTWGMLLLGLTLYRRRLGQYAVVPMVIWIAIALDDLGTWMDRFADRIPHAVRAAAPFVLAALLVAPGFSTLAATPPAPDPRGEVRAALQWLRGRPVRPGREGVLSEWKNGHLVQFVSGRPTLTSPFGVDGGEGAMEDAARFFLARDEASAVDVLSRRRIGYLLLSHPGNEVYVLSGFTDVPEPQPVAAFGGGSRAEVQEIRPAFFGLVPARLYFADGSTAGPYASLGAFRLVLEGPPSGREPLNEKKIKLFEVVPGASISVRGAAPGEAVSASVLVATNQDRRFEWTGRALADRDGNASLRVPYASGPNGLVHAGPYRVGSAGRSAVVEVGEADVMTGRRIEVSLAPPPRASSR